MTPDEQIKRIRALARRRADIIKSHAHGVSLSALGRKYGITRQRVAQIVKAANGAA